MARRLVAIVLGTLAAGCGTLHIEGETTARPVEVWVPPAEGVVVVEGHGQGFVVERSLHAEVHAAGVEEQTGTGLDAFQLAPADWRAELNVSARLASNTPPPPTPSEPQAELRVRSERSGVATTAADFAPPAVPPPSTASRTAEAGAFVDVAQPPISPLERPAARPRQGVWSDQGGATSLGALVDGGLQVDGVRLDLAELEALSAVRLPAAGPDAAWVADGALEAFVELEHDSLPAAGGQTHVVVRLRGNEPARPSPRAPVRVHLVLDRSSSMQRAWPRVLASARALIARLQPEDQLQIVAYGTDVTEAYPLGPVGDGRDAEAALERIVVGGGTHIEAGLSMAYQAAARAGTARHGLVLLLSDGVPNHGTFEPRALSGLARAAREQSGCTTGVVGLGTEFDARLLRSLARAGQGGYHVSLDVDGLASRLVAELDAHARAAARQISLSVRLAPGVELAGPSAGWTADSHGARLALPQIAPGQERRVVLPLQVGASTEPRAVATVRLDYLLSAGSVLSARTAERGLTLSRGPRTPRAGFALQTMLDRSWGQALDRAAQEVRVGNGAAAATALRAHASRVEGRNEHRTTPALQVRARVVRRAAQSLEALTSSAGHGARRRVALELGRLAAAAQR